MTYNYWRKGGYSIGSEDYRWEIIKSKVPAPVFFLFNVTFISTIQSVSPHLLAPRCTPLTEPQVLLFAVATPTYILLLSSYLSGQGMAMADIVFSRLLIVLVVIEWFADQQQWSEYLSSTGCPRRC